jgi:hypothetical protein
MRVECAALAAAMSLALPAHAADVKAVLAAPRDRIETADYRASGHLVRVDANGARTSYAINVRAHWFSGVLRVMLEISSPAPARAYVLLEMRPDGQDSILIAHPGDAAASALPFDKWTDGPLGDGFSYEDFLEPQYFWSGQSVPNETKYGARDCYILRSTPGPTDRTHYAETRTWLDESIGFPVHAEKTLKGSGEVKEFTYLGLRHDGGVWSASQVEAKLRGRPGSTLLIIDRGSAHANLTLKDFSQAQLSHFQDAP